MNPPNIYIELNGKWEGPFSRSQLPDLINSGKAHLQTFCREGENGALRTLEFYTGKFALPSSNIVVSETKKESPKPISGLNAILVVLSGVLILGGIVGLIYFIGFDTSRQVGFTDTRVNNLGLMQDRQVGLIVCALSLVIGVVIAIFGIRSRSST